MKSKVKVKSIDWSYPTSFDARQHGFEQTGCYTVSLGFTGQTEDGVKGFATFPEAQAFANTLPNPWSKYTL